MTIIPGYDDRDTGRPPPRSITDRWCGETQRVFWQQAIAAVPDYALITSRNEWHEGNELELSVECSSCALVDTAAFSRRFVPNRGNQSRWLLGLSTPSVVGDGGRLISALRPERLQVFRTPAAGIAGLALFKASG